MPPLCYLFFDLLQHMSEGHYNKWVQKTALYSFGIFLIHNNFLMLFVRYLDLASFMRKPLAVIIYSILTFACSFLFVELVRRIPRMGPLLFRLPEYKKEEKT